MRRALCKERYILSALILLAICGYPVRGQDDQSRFEVFGAYSMVRFDEPVRSPSREDFIPPLTTAEPEYAALTGSYYYHYLPNMHGWNGSVAFKLTRRFSLVGDFGGQYTPRSRSTSYGEEILPGTGLQLSSSHYSFLVGPRFSFRNSSRFTPFVHVLGGVSKLTDRVSGDWPVRGTVWGPEGQQNYEIRLRETSDSTTGLAGAAGAGLDVRLTRRIALRLAQVDYLLARRKVEGQIEYIPEGSGQSTVLTYRIPRYLQDNLRFSYGVVFTF